MWAGKEFDVGDTVLVATGPFEGYAVMVMGIELPRAGTMSQRKPQPQ